MPYKYHQGVFLKKETQQHFLVGPKIRVNNGEVEGEFVSLTKCVIAEFPVTTMLAGYIGTIETAISIEHCGWITNEDLNNSYERVDRNIEYY